MPKHKANDLARDERRKDVARLYIKGWTQTEIAEKLGKAQGTISSDLRIVQKEWRRSAVKAFESRHAIEIRKLDALERELWRAWEESLKPKRRVQIVKDPESGKETNRSNLTEQNGDPRFLALVQKCALARSELLQPRGAPQESPADVRAQFRLRRDRILAVAQALRERQRLAESRERPDAAQSGDVRSLDEAQPLSAPPAPPPA
jgi:transcriptional regulator with XRE-family HTH domain